MEPKISIITPSYNSEKTLDQTIHSILNQDYRNIEYIIIDGKSKDKTLEIIEKYKSKFEEKKIDYKFISEKDNGIYDAMNKGIELVTGDFFIFLGSDDIFYNEDILKNISKKLKNTSAIYYGDVIFKSKNKRYIGKVNKWKLIAYNICHQAIFYPKELKIKKYDLNYKILGDYKYNLDLMGKENYRFEYLNEIISLYNDSGISSTEQDKYFQQNKFKIIYENFGISGLFFRIFVSPVYRRVKMRLLL